MWYSRICRQYNKIQQSKSCPNKENLQRYKPHLSTSIKFSVSNQHVSFCHKHGPVKILDKIKRYFGFCIKLLVHIVEILPEKTNPNA